MYDTKKYNIKWNKGKWVLFFSLCLFYTILSNPASDIINDIIRDNAKDIIKECYKKPEETQFLVIGAGPAGIATLGVLIQVGVDPADILWLDQEFDVGRIGKYYGSVPSNTKNKLFVDFIESCDVFKGCSSPAIDLLKSCDREKEYPLVYVAEALRAITHYLSTKVHCIKGNLESLYFDNNKWHINTGYIDLAATNVVLATGSHPRTLDYDTSLSKVISLDAALDHNQLKTLVTPEDIVLVVGGCHSAILLLKYLSELSVKKIINLYRRPIQYAIDKGDWILYNSSGLKGATAQWAREVLEKNPPKNLVRLCSNENTIKSSVEECSKIIYAIGYEKNELPIIKENPALEYNEITGVIAPGLFGIGIAFPEKYIDPLGNEEHRVGLASFMEYAQRIVPYWVNKDKELCLRQKLTCLKKFESLFNIDLL